MWAAKDQQAVQAAAYQQQMYAPPPQYAAPPPAPVVEQDPSVAQSNQLVALHAQGVLSDEEFAAAKAKVLGI